MEPDFIYLRSVFFTLIVFLLILLLVITIQPKNKYLNSFSFFSILFICLVTSSITLGAEGYIVDAYGLGGDVVTSHMWLIIVFLSMINTAVFIIRDNKNKRSSK